MEEKNLLMDLDGVKYNCANPVHRTDGPGFWRFEVARPHFLLSNIMFHRPAPAGDARKVRNAQIENRFRNFLFQKLKNLKKNDII